MGAFVWGMSKTHGMVLDARDLTEILEPQAKTPSTRTEYTGILPDCNLLDSSEGKKTNHFEFYFTSFLYTCSQNVLL